MFDVGYSELLVIAIVMIVVVGPKDLPKMLRAFGKATSKFRQMSGDFKRQFDDALKEAELDEVKKTFDSVKKLDPRQQVKDVLNPFKTAASGIRDDIMKPAAPKIEPKVEAAVVAPTAAPKKTISSNPAAKKTAPKAQTSEPIVKVEAKSAAKAAPVAKAGVKAKAPVKAKPTK